MEDSSHATRRGFLALTAASYQRILGANDRVGLGFIGYGLIGGRHVEDFKTLPDVDLAAVCDVYQPRLEQGVAACGARAKGYRDFRKLLEDKDIQGVVVSTPDHWHALQTILACAAGKDVYVEKPMTLFVAEGRWMVTAARRYNRVVTAGTQQRSGPHFREAVKLVRGGYLGKVQSIRIGAFRNIMPGFGVTPDSAPPDGFDYDLWLGPAPLRPYSRHRSLYHFRWFWDYSGGQMTNLGTHEMDVVHWAMQVKGPRAVSSSGGRFALEDDGETPDTQDALFEYPGFTVVVSIREAAAGKRSAGGFELFGTRACMSLSRDGFEVTPEMKAYPENAIPPWSAPAGHPPRREDWKPQPWTRPLKAAGSSDEQMRLHARNFVDCIKSRERPAADVEDAHRVSAACHLANISLRLGRKIRWDPETERVIGDAEASAHLVRPYRKPWDAVLGSLNL
jgi:predicted dehydrogenase